MDKPANSVGLFNKLAELYQQKYMDVSLYHDMLDAFCRRVDKSNANVLELACGPGNVTKYMLSKRPDFKILGTDLAPNMVALAAKNNPTATFEIMDCRDISKITAKYDAIVCSFCLPYLTKDETAAMISDAATILNPGGLLYLSTMENDYTKSGPVASSTGEYITMYFYSAAMLTRILEENGFTVETLHRQPFPTNDESKVTDMIAIARVNP